MGREERRRKPEKRVAKLLAAHRAKQRRVVDFGRYRDDPVGFCREVLGVESATRRSDGSPYQFDILTDLVTSPRVIVRSGHGVGKSAVDAWAVLWWVVCRGWRAVVVAPQFTRQIRAVLFAEIGRWARHARVPLPIEVLGHRVLMNGVEVATGMPATDPNRLEGFHSSGGVLVVTDEMKGIGQDVFDALQGALTGGDDSRLLVTSTPGGSSGPFYRIWARGGDAWRYHHIPSPDSSLVSPQWCEDRKREWGEGSPLWTARGIGGFADEGEGVLFPNWVWEGAQAREVAAEGEKQMGVDVGRSVAGDPCCIAITWGLRLIALHLARFTDLMAVTQWVMHHALTSGVTTIRVDEGGVGAGVVDRLRALGFPVVGVMFGGGADDPTRFRNKRAEMYFALRERMETSLALPDDDDLIADLSCIRYRFDQSGRVLLEAKDDIRRRLGRSPDRADAVALALGTSKRYTAPWRVGTFRI